MENFPVIILIAIFVAAFLAPWLHRVLGDRCGLVLSLVPLAGAAGYLMLLPQVLAGQAVVFQRAWVP